MSAAKDRNGKTEEQFLREYDVTRFFRPSVTTDAVLFCPTDIGGRILLIKRGGHPFLGRWAFPGGFVEENEPCETTAVRELEEETGITGVALRQLVTASTPNRDPRHRNITVIYYALLDSPIKAVGGDDAAAAKWFDVECGISGGNAVLSFCAADGSGERFDCELTLVRDAFGDVDLNKTAIKERGETAFDHAKIVLYLIDTLRRKK